VEEFDKKKGVYVDLRENDEAYTGYQGQHIWKMIY
jgi:ERO1-like protein alpha